MELVAYTDADMALRGLLSQIPGHSRRPPWPARTVGDVAAPEPGGEVVATE
jgi:hypothetical protein